MELSFASSLWLAGLSALALPVLLHWLASQDRKPHRFAPIRFLQAIAAEQRGRRLSELLLLCLRMLLIALVVLALAQPSIEWWVARNETVVLLHPAVRSTALNASTDDETFRLCEAGELLAIDEPCPADNADRDWLGSVEQAVAAHPRWQRVTLTVPPLWLQRPLALSALPVALHWQVAPDDHLAPDFINELEAGVRLPWRVAVDDDSWRYFDADNRLQKAAYWQRAKAGDVADLVIAQSASAPSSDWPADSDWASQPDAKVYWHDRALPWQTDGANPAVAFHLDQSETGVALHLRWPSGQEEAVPALMAATRQWLQRGEAVPFSPLAMASQTAHAEAEGRQLLSLAPWLWLAALLCWCLERWYRQRGYRHFGNSNPRNSNPGNSHRERQQAEVPS